MNWDRLNRMSKQEMYDYIANLIRVGTFEEEEE